MTTHAGAEQDGAAQPLPNDLQAWLDQQERDILIRAPRKQASIAPPRRRLGISLRQIRYRIARLNIGVPNDQDFQDEIG
jgi:two-component system response regulator PilR (NtrC family)